MTKHEEEVFDVVIVGSGPAGISAAIWAADLGLEAVVVEGSGEPGGNLLNIYNPVTNYPGIIAQNGREVRDAFLGNAERSNAVIRLSSRADRIDPEAGTVELEDGTKLRYRNVLLATGVRRRML